MSTSSKIKGAKAKPSRSNSRSQRRRRRSRGVHPLVWIGGAVGIVVVLFGVSLSRSGLFREPPAPSRSEDPAELQPLAQSGRSLRGGHDMALIPDQPPAPRSVAAGTPVPRVNIPSVSYDFGSVYSSWDLTHTFAVQNTGDVDLVIDNLVTSCGCTVAELTNDVIPPGQRADLTVTFDANFHETSGEVTRLVWFATNDPAQPWVEVRIAADVRS